MPTGGNEIENATEQVVRDLQREKDPEGNFRILFERYHPQVKRFLCRKGLSMEDAEELTQDVFISVYKGVEGLHDPSQFEPWLFRIALNTFRNHIDRSRAKKRDAIQVELGGGQSEDSPDQSRFLGVGSVNTGVDDLIDAQRRAVIGAAIEALPEQMRLCMKMRIVHELSNAEISQLMGISINTVKAHLYQARKVLMEKLEPEAGEL
ncbi:MAG TPA: sigma-70 family RNA polymerase sigma factor [Blastocatellia bacterium]|nr:sigma-70 family RNA polymerase sigma factor [Blastocatellia bacterium]